MATKSSKIHVYIFMILIFFLCLLSFSVGTFVGKSVTESEMRKAQVEMATNLTKEREIASLESEGNDSENNAELAEDEVTLTGEEIESLAKEFSEGEDASGNDAKDPNLKDGKEKLPDSSSKTTISDVTQRIAKDESATEKLAKTRTPSTVLPALASSLGKFTVQIASYTDKKEANDHALKLKAKGYSAFFVPALIRGKEWYRVSVGLFDNSNKANSFRKTFIKRTQLESAIVQEIKEVRDTNKIRQ